MKKPSLSNEYIRSMNKSDIFNLTQEQITKFSIDQLSLLSFDQMDWFTLDQLKYFNSSQKKVLSINIITKSIDEIQKLNLNALSDIELKSLLKHQIEALTYDQIVNILPYIFHQNKISIGTIGNFRAKQYSFFTLQQIKWFTMYQSANIPKQYLSFEQIKKLPPPCFDFPKDVFTYFIHKNEIETFDMKNFSINYCKYISKYTIRQFSYNQLNNIPNEIFMSNEMIYKIKYLSKNIILKLNSEKLNIIINYKKKITSS
jgi:hypothetical protein